MVSRYARVQPQNPYFKSRFSSPHFGFLSDSPENWTQGDQDAPVWFEAWVEGVYAGVEKKRVPGRWPDEKNGFRFFLPSRFTHGIRHIYVLRPG